MHLSLQYSIIPVIEYSIPVPFSELSHTGDLQYRVTGKAKEELFADAARALFSTITDLGKIEEKDKRELKADGETQEELFINFLRACLDLFNTDEFVAKRCIVSFDGSQPLVLSAVLNGESFDPSRHPFRTEIKAVTYHGASCEETQEGWDAVFTLDL